jgi:rubrerythrin
MIDVYTCHCSEEFAVKDGKEPTYCPFCGSPYIEFSHEVAGE